MEGMFNAVAEYLVSLNSMENMASMKIYCFYMMVLLEIM